MSRPLRILYPGAYYHITCRGNERKEIFSNDEDRKLFLDKLLLSSNIFNVPILSYVLMKNHFHLLLTTPEANLPDFMRHFNISYTAVYNRRHGRIGHLYQGRYKAYLVEADSYLLELSRYIHLNPVRTKGAAKKNPKERWSSLLKYRWSSFEGYLYLGKRKPFVNHEMVLAYVGGDNRKGRLEYRKFVRWGLDKDTKSPLEIGKGSGIVGCEDYLQEIKDKYLKKEKGTREQPELRELRKVFKPQELMNEFLSLTQKNKDDVCKRGRNSIERAMLMEFLYRFCRITQPEIGEIVGGIDYSAVSQARHRLRKKLKVDRKLRVKFDEINQKLTDLPRSTI